MTTAALPRVVVVKANNSRFESLCVMAVTAMLVAATLVFAKVNARVDHTPPLMDWQLRAFDLNPTDQAIFNALTVAADTVWVWYEDAKTWTPVEDMQSETVGVAPFMLDASWRQTGEVQWRLDRSFSFEGATAYFGNNGKVPGQSAYLLVLGHTHKGVSYADQSTIWLHPDPRAAAPRTLNRDSLIRNGWKQVVSHTGDVEVRQREWNPPL